MKDGISPKNQQASYDEYRYSPAVRSDSFSFVSGQVGVDEKGIAFSDPAAQFDQASANLGNLLNTAGCNFDNIVDITSFHVDMYDHFEALAAVKQKVFSKPHSRIVLLSVWAI